MVIGVNILLLLTATAKSSNLMDSSTAYAVYYSTFVVLWFCLIFARLSLTKDVKTSFIAGLLVSFAVFRRLSPT